jgi:GTPase-associated protein 1, N-terminal domain type 2/GTPase-associated protein 1, C-terminal domain/GTPase-associated protein 1, middle domain
MGFAQLYYTSCETGLSGFAGFQFNAATPGLSPQVLREVEALTSYEPPRWLGFRPTAQEIAGCPVNLVYLSEPTTILANVVYSGADFSGRFGNYFAHALVSRTGVDQFGKVLPIELWGSKVWVTEPAGTTELLDLARLPGPSPDSPVSREAVDRFVREGLRAEYLPALLTAAENAVLGGGRPIVIIEPDTAAAARWIAAISFLLPPGLARRLSFATYHHRPSYINVHVIATLPDSDFYLDEAASRGYVVLDTVTGDMSDVAPEPAAALLARVGPGRADALWECAANLIGAPGAALADWHPALVMAAILGDGEVQTADLDVLSEWLAARAADVDPARRGDVVTAFLASPACTPWHLKSLSVLAHLAGEPAFAAAIERAAVAEELRRAEYATEEAVGTGVPIVTEEGRIFATKSCTERLAGAPAHVAISLLGWSTNLGLELPDEALRACGEHTLGPALIQVPDEDTLGVLAGARPLLEGALDYLATVPEEHSGAVTHAFAAGLGDLVSEAGIALPARLREPALLARARNVPASRVDVLRSLAGEDPGARGPLEESLLLTIWPDGSWTAAEALAVAETLGPQQLRSGPPRDWIIRAVMDPRREGAYVEAYIRLCRVVSAGAIGEALPEGVRNQLASVLGAAGELEHAAAASGMTRARILQHLAGSYDGQPPATQDILRDSLARQLAEPVNLDYLPMVAGSCPPAVVAVYLDDARRKLAVTPPNAALVAPLFQALVTLQSAEDAVAAPDLETILREGLQRWRRADLDQLYEQLYRADPKAGDAFVNWRRQRPAATFRRFVTRLLEGDR